MDIVIIIGSIGMHPMKGVIHRGLKCYPLLDYIWVEEIRPLALSSAFDVPTIAYHMV